MLQQNFTPLSRTLLIVSFLIYIAQLATGMLLYRLFAWLPFGGGFMPWQPLTAFLLTGPDPKTAAFGWVGIFFLVGMTQRVLGNRKLAYAVLATWAGIVVSTLLLLAFTPLPSTMYVGYEPLLLALISLFGFYAGDAQVLLMFVLPVPAIWMAWGSGVYALLWLAFMPGNVTWASVAAWLSVFVFQYIDQGGLRRFRNQRQRAQVARRFAVHEGGGAGGKPVNWDN